MQGICYKDSKPAVTSMKVVEIVASFCLGAIEGIIAFLV